MDQSEAIKPGARIKLLQSYHCNIMNTANLMLIKIATLLAICFTDFESWTVARLHNVCYFGARWGSWIIMD